MFEEVLPKQHAVINKMLEAAKDAKKESDKETFLSWAKDLLEADKFLIDKLYIVQIAAQDGWKLANQVKFLEAGKYSCLVSAFNRAFKNFPFCVVRSGREPFVHEGSRNAKQAERESRFGVGQVQSLRQK